MIDPPEVIALWTNKTMHRLWALRASRYQWVRIRTKTGFYLWVNKKRSAFKAQLKIEKTKVRRERKRSRKQKRIKPVRTSTGIRTRTKRARDEAVARHRADRISRGPQTKRDLAEVIASLTAAERKVIAADEHVISAIEKIVEAMLFRFS